MQQLAKGPRTPMGLLDYYLVTKAPFRIPDRTKERIVRGWPRITTIVLMIVLLLLPFLKIWLNLAEFGASFGGAGEVATFHYIEIALVVQMVTNGDIVAKAVQTKS